MNTVRRARPADVSRIAEILVFAKRVAYRDIFRDENGSFNELQVLPVAAQYAGDARLLEQTLVYDDGVVKGVLHGLVAGEQAEICQLYVDPFFQGKGVGRALAEAFLQSAAGARRARLWVIRDNASARRFYAGLGFRPTGEEQPVEGTDVIEMRYEKDLL